MCMEEIPDGKTLQQPKPSRLYASIHYAVSTYVNVKTCPSHQLATDLCPHKTRK